MLKIVRWLLGRLILSLNWLFSPTAPKRDAQAQAQVDESARALRLYEFKACPFCVKVRREMRRLGVNVERRDAARNQNYRAELLSGGGEYKVPCLRIDEGGAAPVWLYESKAIVSYLREKFPLTQ